jgi:hypothetical protein
LLQRTLYGPQFALASQGNVMGVSTNAVGLRPYADLTLGMTWRQVGLCQAPAASVMGLAPGEVVTVGIRTTSSRTFTDLVSDAASSSQTITHSDRFLNQQGTQPAPQTGGGGGDSSGGGGILSSVVSLAPMAIALFASIWDDALSVGEAAAGAIAGGAGDIAGAAAGAIGGLIDNGITGGGGGSSAVVQTSSMTQDILDEISRTQSQSHLHQTTVTTSEESEQTIKRTFGNPYLDRSLQLRFIPVFNQFEITIALVRITPGFVTHFLEPTASIDPRSLGGIQSGGMQLRLLAAQQAPSVRPVASALHVTDQAGADDAVRRPMLDMLRTVGSRGNDPAALEHGLSWSQTQVRGNGIHVPLSATADVVSAWKLKEQTAARFKASMTSIANDRLGAIFKPLVQTVSVYAGTHVEAVPGSCVLPDIPAELRVIVPGGTDYTPRRSES